MQKRILPTTSCQHGRGRKLAGTAERKLAQSQTTLPQKFMTIISLHVKQQEHIQINAREPCQSTFLQWTTVCVFTGGL
jgi:hypothetical protein